MPRTSTIKTHEDRQEIEEAILNGTPYRNIAERFGISIAALSRHKSEHMPAHLTKAKKAEEVAAADDLLRQIRTLQYVTLKILRDAEAAGEKRTALKAIGEGRRNLELLSKLSGQLQQEGAVTIINSPQYVEIRQTIIEALRPYPKARSAVAEALKEAP